MTTKTNLKPHPIAEMLPPLRDDEYAQLKADIAENGLNDPISVWVNKNGHWVVDGLNRWKICKELGKEAETEPWDFGGDADVAKFVISRNLHRRHLTDSTRAMLAARLAEHFKPAAEERMKNGTDPGKNADKGRALDKSAEAVNAPAGQTRQASALQAQGCAELIALVDDGKIKISPAELVARTLTPEDQKALVAKGPAAVKKKASQIREQKQKQKAAADALKAAEAAAGLSKPVEAAPVEDPGFVDEPESKPRREVTLGGDRTPGRDAIVEPKVEPVSGEFFCPHCGCEIEYQLVVDYMASVEQAD